MECIQLNRLSEKRMKEKHLKKVRSRQASISINYCTELSKKQFFPVSIVKIEHCSASNLVRLHELKQWLILILFVM